MQLMASLIAVMLLAWSARATVLPGEEKFSAQSSKEQTKARRSLLTRLMVALLDSSSVDEYDLYDSELEEELSKRGQRYRKAACKNFFWKTFTAC